HRVLVTTAKAAAPRISVTWSKTAGGSHLPALAHDPHRSPMAGGAPRGSRPPLRVGFLARGGAVVVTRAAAPGVFRAAARARGRRGHIWNPPQLLDPARVLMAEGERSPGGPRLRRCREYVQIGVTGPGAPNLDQNLTRTRLGHRHLAELSRFLRCDELE